MPVSNLKQKLDKARKEIEPIMLQAKALNHALNNVVATIDELETELDKEECK